MAWSTSLPVSSTLIADIPTIHKSNWAVIEDAIGREHYGFSSSLSGKHNASAVPVLCAGTTEVINNISSPATGALAWDTTLGIGKVYLGSWNQINMLAMSRVDTYRSSNYTLVHGHDLSANAVAVPFNTEVKDTLSEYNTSTYIFTSVASSGYYLVQATLCLSVTAGYYNKISTYISVLNSSGIEQYQDSWGVIYNIGSNEFSTSCVGMVYLPAGYKIKIMIYDNATANRVTIKGGQAKTFLKIHRIS
jgi:hypothetical protein